MSHRTAITLLTIIVSMLMLPSDAAYGRNTKSKKARLERENVLLQLENNSLKKKVILCWKISI